MEWLSGLGGLIGGIFGSNNQKKIAQQQMALQREFAQNSVQWRVKDAQAANIHPLAALGMQPMSYTPVTVGDQNWADIGQNLGRSIAATQTVPQKVDDFTQTSQKLSLERQGLENAQLTNDVLASSIRLNNIAGTPPAMPGFGIRGSDDKGEKKRDPLGLPFGLSWEMPPHLSPMQDVVNELGEPAENYLHPFYLYDMFKHNLNNSIAHLGRDRRKGRDEYGKHYSGGW